MITYTHRDPVEDEFMSEGNAAEPPRFQEYYDVAVEHLGTMDMLKVFQVLDAIVVDHIDDEIDFMDAYHQFDPDERIKFVAHHYARFKTGISILPSGEIPDVRAEVNAL